VTFDFIKSGESDNIKKKNVQGLIDDGYAKSIHPFETKARVLKSVWLASPHSGFCFGDERRCLFYKCIQIILSKMSLK